MQTWFSIEEAWVEGKVFLQRVEKMKITEKRETRRDAGLLNHRSTSKELVAISSRLSSRFFQLSNRIREHS
jgi:hypothetical protein